MADLGKCLKKNKPVCEQFKPVNKGSVVLENSLNSFIADLKFKEAYSKIQSQQSFISFPLLPYYSNGSKLLKDDEESAFFSWKKAVIELEAVSTLSPYEKNIEIWRQFHLLIKCCSIVVQVVDCRNPLFYWNDEVHQYVSALGKLSLILLNKSDLLTADQLHAWHQYLESQNIVAVSFSSLNPTHIISIIQDRLGIGSDGDRIGFLGYPNVGKSSVINCITSSEYHCASSTTPGKTKHLQSFVVGSDVVYDCPGFVFPKVSTKDELVIGNVLPLSILTDAVAPLRFFFKSFPINLAYAYYKVPHNDDRIASEYGISRDDTTMLLLFSISLHRHYFTSNHGIPDYTKSARIILKDIAEGRLLLRIPPNASKIVVFNGFPNELISGHDCTIPQAFHL
jgi:ribosome biogenesis GTPase A